MSGDTRDAEARPDLVKDPEGSGTARSAGTAVSWAAVPNAR